VTLAFAAVTKALAPGGAFADIVRTRQGYHASVDSIHQNLAESLAPQLSDGMFEGTCLFIFKTPNNE